MSSGEQPGAPRPSASGRAQLTFLAMMLSFAAGALGCGGDPERHGAGNEPERGHEPSGNVTSYERPMSAEPRPRLSAGSPPNRLLAHDVRRGTGAQLRHGDEAIVNYVGYVFETRRKYDTSYSDSDPLPLEVMPGEGHMIAGFERGVVGMRVGGRRQVIIPPALAYGDRGYPPSVKPNQTLVFVIELEHVWP